MRDHLAVTSTLGLVATIGLAVAPANAHETTCQSASIPSEAIDELRADPRDLSARLRLADAMLAANCFADAVRTLEEGEATHGRNAQLQSQLRQARSMMREQSYFEGLNRAEEAAKLSHSLLRCTRMGDLDACDQALARQPDDPQIVVAKADALVQAQRPGAALEVYRRAHQLAPQDATVEQKISAAEAQRQAFREACQNDAGQSALHACHSALLPGSEDEFAIRKRTAILLQASNQPSAALDSYIAANLLKRDDRSVALAILALSGSTGRKDALTLAARGSALLTLGRALDALTPLKQAVALSPEIPGAKTQLAQAERLAREEARRKAATAAAERAPPATLAEAPATRRYSNAAPMNRSN